MKRNAALLARSVLMRNAVIAVLISCVTLSSALAKGFDGLRVFVCSTGDRYAYFGDLHVHATNSLDASIKTLGDDFSKKGH